MDVLKQQEIPEQDEYIGICEIGNIMFTISQNFEEYGNIELQKENLLQAIEINPFSSSIFEEAAIYYELNEKNFIEAERYYRESINCDPMSKTVLFNFAGFFEINKQYSEMLEYYTQSALKGDPEAYLRICHYWWKIVPNTENMLAALYKCIDIGYSDDYQVNEDIERKKKDSENKVFLTIEDILMKEFSPFVLFDHIQEFDVAGPNIQKCLQMIKSKPEIMIYDTKVRLFQRLANIADCGICLENKLNIDLYCGHEVCNDCYKMVYEDCCPFCRIKPPQEPDSDSESSYHDSDSENDSDDDDDADDDDAEIETSDELIVVIE